MISLGDFFLILSKNVFNIVNYFVLRYSFLSSFEF